MYSQWVTKCPETERLELSRMTLSSVVTYINTKYVVGIHNGRLPGKQSLFIQDFNLQKAVKCNFCFENLLFSMCWCSRKNTDVWVANWLLMNENQFCFAKQGTSDKTAAWLKQVINYMKQAAYMNSNASPFAALMLYPSKPECLILMQLCSVSNAQEKLKGKTEFLLSLLS